jgi:hypothetical protein
MKMKKISLSLTFSLSLLFNYAQTLTGNWFGTANIYAPGNNYNNYMTEIVLEEEGNRIKGQMNYYFRDSYQSVPLEGYFSANRQELVIREFTMLHYANTSTGNGVDVSMSGELKLKKSRVETTLEGYLTPAKRYRNTSPDMFVQLKKMTDEEVEEQKRQRHQDSIEVQKNILLDKQKPVFQDANTTVLIDAFKTRRNNVQQVIETAADSVIVKLYDNGDIDNDSVSVFLNGEIVQKNQKLKASEITLTVQLNKDKETNDLTLFAENLGLFPPNTALLVMEVDGKRYEVRLSSSLVHNATVRFVKKQSPAGSQ